MAVKERWIPSPIVTQTYLFVADVASQNVQVALDAGFPETWLGVLPDYEIDPDVVGPDDLFNGLYRDQFAESLLAIPTLSLVMDVDDMFGAEGIYTNPLNRGIDWERPTSVELIPPNGDRGFQIDAGIRVQGAGSRSHDRSKKKSFSLKFRERYGAGKLEFPLFGDDAADRFDTIVLRGSYNDGWLHPASVSSAQYIRDQWSRATQRAMGNPSARGTWMHVYINGVYWGLYNAVERPDASFAASYLGGDKEAWDALSHGGLISGTRDAWEALLSLASQVDTSDQEAGNAAYQRLLGNAPDGTRNPQFEILLDVDNMIDYLILNMYSGNGDWPYNNWYVARRRGPESTGFKFFSWDAEKTLAGLRTNQIDVERDVARVYSHLRANAEFRQRFADRVQFHFFNQGALAVDPDRSRPADRYEALSQEIELAIVAESARWGDAHTEIPRTADDWKRLRDGIVSGYLPNRSQVVIGQLTDAGLFSKLAAPVFNQHGGEIGSGFSLEMGAPGAIYYTVDGSDPRQRAAAVETVTLLDAPSPATALIPRNGSLATRWTEPGFDDSTWRAGETGLGFERSTGYQELIGIDVEISMFGVNASAYLRVPFQVPDPQQLDGLILQMKYDDGFVAYLNGVEVARSNAPKAVQWNSVATQAHSDSAAVVFQSFNIGSFVDMLRPGENILAIHALNSNARSNDFLAVPALTANVVTDPGIRPSAARYDRPIPLTRASIIQARTQVGGEWSPLTTARFAMPSPLRISEIMYHPADTDGRFESDDFEFIEVTNTSPSTIDVTGASFTQGIRFTFPTLLLGPDEAVVVVRNRQAFRDRYGPQARIAGEYGTGTTDTRLDNGGETLRLEDATGTVIQEFRYDDAWYPRTDGEGYSLEILDPHAQQLDRWDNKLSWLPSIVPGGTPSDDRASVPVTAGDLDLNGVVDETDIRSLALALNDPISYRARFGIAPSAAGDTDGDGDLDFDDIRGFTRLLDAHSTALAAKDDLFGTNEVLRPRDTTSSVAGNPRNGPSLVDELLS
ncbi:MAG: CotH kinase family protein [Pirellulales bacterium]